MKLKISAVLLLIVLAAGCPSGGGGEKAGTGTLTLMISDAEADIGDFDYVKVTFEEARIFKSGTGFDEGSNESMDNESMGDSGGYETMPINYTVDLTQVVGDKAVSVAQAPLGEGRYTKIELHVASVEAALKDSDEVPTVMVPSNKLMITKPFTITAGQETRFVFDINVVRKGKTASYNLLPVIGKSGEAGKDVEVKEVSMESNETMMEENDNESMMEENESMESM